MSNGDFCDVAALKRYLPEALDTCEIYPTGNVRDTLEASAVL